MNFQDLPIIEQLQLLRITADSQIPPHRFLFSWNGTPCFAKAELVAVTGKAKSGKTYLNSMLMAAAMADVFAAVMNGHSEMRAGVLKTQTKLKVRIVSSPEKKSLTTKFIISPDPIWRRHPSTLAGSLNP